MGGGGGWCFQGASGLGSRQLACDGCECKGGLLGDLEALTIKVRG